MRQIRAEENLLNPWRFSTLIYKIYINYLKYTTDKSIFNFINKINTGAIFISTFSSLRYFRFYKFCFPRNIFVWDAASGGKYIDKIKA